GRACRDDREPNQTGEARYSNEAHVQPPLQKWEDVSHGFIVTTLTGSSLARVSFQPPGQWRGLRGPFRSRRAASRSYFRARVRSSRCVIWKAAAAGDLFQPGGEVPVVCAGGEVPLGVAPSQAALGIVGGFGCVAWAASAHATLDSAPLLNARLPSTPA